MAERPIFVSRPASAQLVEEIFLQLKWHPGFAPVQKEKNIRALHEAAARAGHRNVLEVSTKSDNPRGQELSAFNLKVRNEKLGEIPLECAFQGSKVFERGGPFTDLYSMDVRSAKKDPRLRESGKLVAFEFDGVPWPLEPKTLFYDWLYLGSIDPSRDRAHELLQYGGFSDIEFNPVRSINCQARSIALFLSLMQRGELGEAVKYPSGFLRIIGNSDYRPDLRIKESSSKSRFG
jgi:uncharacterized protein DUF6977